MLANLAKDTQSSLIEMQNERLNSILRLHGEYQKNNVEINTLASNASIIDNIQSQSFIETTSLLRDSHPLVTGKKSNRITVTSKRKKEHKVA
jgi:hypothetical protein